jgi:hypothetical protein
MAHWGPSSLPLFFPHKLHKIRQKLKRHPAFSIQSMESCDNISLNDLSSYLGHNNPAGVDAVQNPHGQTSHHEFSLPPADGGKAA